MSCSNLLHTPSWEWQRRRLLGSSTRLCRFPLSQTKYATWNSNLRENDITSWAVSLLRNQQSEFPRLIAHDGIQSTSSNTLLENFRLAFDEYAFIVTSLLLSDAQALVCLRALRNCYFIHRLIVICC